jgi:hypothetical protein
MTYHSRATRVLASKGFYVQYSYLSFGTHALNHGRRNFGIGSTPRRGTHWAEWSAAPSILD